MNRTLCIADMHGSYKALKQCMERSGFNYSTDTLICLGDTVDSYPQTKECFDELLKIDNLINILGNHDSLWGFLNWAKFGVINPEWFSQGGQNTILSYPDGVPDEHIKLLRTSIYKYLDDQDRLFVHGGFDWRKPLEDNTPDVFMWDRQLIEYAKQCAETKSCKIPKPLKKYNEIYVGHTTTELYQKLSPIKFCNVWLQIQAQGAR
ncbi:MAG: hypothetical protein DKM50_13415 [Candidatus Margulisiibacteriota bacterium]|nr:MAG: hypothetical protein DKM50_13415 [Candidatus Margulisiibacteriota bacterium]